MTIDYSFSSTKDLVMLTNMVFDLSNTYNMKCLIYCFEESINYNDTVRLNFCKMDLSLLLAAYKSNMLSKEECDLYSSFLYTEDETFLIINSGCHPTTRDFIHTFLENQAEQNEFTEQFVVEASMRDKYKNGY